MWCGVCGFCALLSVAESNLGPPGFGRCFDYFSTFLTILKNKSQMFCDKIHAYLLTVREPPYYLASLMNLKESDDIKNSLISFWGPIEAPGTLRVKSFP